MHNLWYRRSDIIKSKQRGPRLQSAQYGVAKESVLNWIFDKIFLHLNRAIAFQEMTNEIKFITDSCRQRLLLLAAAVAGATAESVVFFCHSNKFRAKSDVHRNWCDTFNKNVWPFVSANLIQLIEKLAHKKHAFAIWYTNRRYNICISLGDIYNIRIGMYVEPQIIFFPVFWNMVKMLVAQNDIV